MGCVTNCVEFGPPPDMILFMPPPPLPSFLIPKTVIFSSVGNETNPCFASSICEPNSHTGESGTEFIELSAKEHIALEYTWLIALFASCFGVLLLGTLLTIILIKCRYFSYSYQENNVKQSTISAFGQNSKSNPFISSGMLYSSASNRDSLQQHLANENRLLWATLTPHGTRHFVSNFPVQDSHYETVDYKNQYQNESVTRSTPVKSFDNSGFIDYDYEDPTPLMDSYHDELDSGYQEPDEIIAALARTSPRPTVTTPTKTENQKMSPLNALPHRTPTSTLNKKSTLSRRISDVSSDNSHNI